MSEHSPNGRKCPICSKPTVQNFRPFCSKRCADLDLSRWLKGSYAIPSASEDLPDTPPDDGESDE